MSLLHEHREQNSRTSPEFSSEERTLLLNIARESIIAAIQRNETSLTTPSTHLAEPRGVFSTLYSRGELRGCVGFALPIHPLYQAVTQTARAAAFEDTRFPPLSHHEIAGLTISLSVLSLLQPIPPEEVEVGRHGLVVSHEGRTGLLLPQVAVERGWDRVKFLEQVCVKAGLPQDAWRYAARIEVFTAEVFGEP